MKKEENPFIIHPFLFAIYPILYLFLINITEAKLSALFFPILITLFCSILFFNLLLLLKVDKRLSGLLTMFLCIGFYLELYEFSILMVFLKSIANVYEFLGNTKNMLILISVLFSIMFLIVKIDPNLISITKVLNLVSLYLVLSTFFIIAHYKIENNFNEARISSQIKIPTISKDSINKESQVDIYYFIFDRYASNDSLKKYYHFDNSNFLNELKKRGFFITNDAHSNYLKTKYSLASSLNMDYINYFIKYVHGNKTNQIPLYNIIENNLVVRLLKSRGYKFISCGNWWEPSRHNKNADRNINLFSITEFSNILYSTTFLAQIEKILNLHLINLRFCQMKNELYKFEEISKIASNKEKTFVFAHFLLPHPPHVFDKEGNYLPETEEKKRTREINYTEQLIFTNKKILKMIDEILANSSQPPIIILQSDEGPFPVRFDADPGSFQWKKATYEELDEKSGIINSYFLPNFKDKENILYESISPVNSFRVIFNHYFNTSLPLLEDKYFAYEDDAHPYKFFEVSFK